MTDDAIAITAAPGRADQQGTIDISDAGRVLWTYRFAGTDRPHIHPLRTPAGHVLTVDSPADHPWHHGLWFTIKYVNGENYWEEIPPFGRLVTRADPAVSADGTSDGGLTITSTIDWVPAPDGTPVITELRSFRHVPLGDDGYAIDLHAALTPAVDVLADRTPFTTWGGYGGLAFRGRGDWHDTRILLADGSTHDRVLGTPAAWFDLTGPIPTDEDSDDEAVVGLSISGGLAGSDQPVPWYGSTRAATYGDDGWSNFFNAAILWDGPLEVTAGTTLHVRHRVVVHDGHWSKDRLDAAHGTLFG